VAGEFVIPKNIIVGSKEPTCYETPKEKRISRAFGNLTDNIKVT